MNKDRRKTIDQIIACIADFEALKDELVNAVNNVRDEEQDYYDNMPEGLQQGEKGRIAEEAVSELDDALVALDNLDITDLTTALETAKGQ